MIRLRWLAAAVLVAAGAVRAEQFPAGEGRKVSPEEIARLTELGKQISNLTKEDLLKLEDMAPPYPTEFAVALNCGYGGADDFPKTVAKFEELLVSMTNSGYNTLYAPYKEWRAPLCRKHGVKMMIDILAWFDDAQNDIRDPRLWQRPRVKQICERVRDDRAVWGYNIWNEPIDEYYRGGGNQNAHICYLKHWDGTHPVWVGTKYTKSTPWVRGKPGCMAWYDYHWARGFGFHYAHCPVFALDNENRDSTMGRWEYVGGVNQNLYTANQSMAWGLKTLIWFIGGAWDRKTQQWNPNHNFCQASRQIQPLYEEIGKIGRPLVAQRNDKGVATQLQVYSTPEIDPATGQPRTDPKTGNVKTIGGWTAFPSQHWAQVKSGSVVAGFFKYPNGDDAIFVANHDAGKPMDVTLDLGPRRKQSRERFVAGLFDRATRQWKELPLKDGAVQLSLAPAGGELVAVGPALRRSPRTPEELSDKDPDWATSALYVGYHAERSDLQKAAGVYQSILKKATDEKAKKQAEARLKWVQARIPLEEEAWAAYEKLLAQAKGLKEAPAADAAQEAKDAWRAKNADPIAKLQEGVKALYATHPDTMGGARARGLLEQHGIAEVL